MAVLTATVVAPAPPLALATVNTRARPEDARFLIREDDRRRKASAMASAGALRSRYSVAPARMLATMVAGWLISPMANRAKSSVAFRIRAIALRERRSEERR